MRLTIEFGKTASSQREVHLRADKCELASAQLHLAFPDRRNRTDRFLRRHVKANDKFEAHESVDPNSPVVSREEPPKLSIPVHIEQMRQHGQLVGMRGPVEGEQFCTEPATIIVPVSDLVANLLRPAYHRNGLGSHRLFFLEEEPIDQKDYFCLCFFQSSSESVHLEIKDVRFDQAGDRVLCTSGKNLEDKGLVWAAALVPLVRDGNALDPVEIAQGDYDLRQILGRNADVALRYAYEGWFECWEERVRELVSAQVRESRPFESFYHSVLALDADGNIHIFQLESTLPDLALNLAAQGMISAGLLDSGGSCAIYDAWMGSYLNHGWYFRERRGAVIALQFKTIQRIPQSPDFWFLGRRGTL